MSNEEKERCCKSCGKRLIDEKIFCRRCVLEGRNKVGQVGVIVSGLLVSAFSAVALLNNNSDNTDTQA